MSITKYDTDISNLHRQVELLQEQIGLITRLREIELERIGLPEHKLKNEAKILDVQILEVQDSKPKNRLVRPVSSSSSEMEVNGIKKRGRGRPKGSRNVKNTDGKSISLENLLENIAREVKKPLLQKEFVALVNQAGYSSGSKKFSNVVYQSLLKLVKKGRFVKDEATKTYEFVAEDAA